MIATSSESCAGASCSKDAVSHRARGDSIHVPETAAPSCGASWLVELAKQGCHAAILVHDLDRNPLNNSLNELAVLERELNAIPVPRGLIRHICVPVEEIEAWFFSSEKVLARVCGKPQRAHPSPHRIARPKEKLIDLSRGANRRPRYSQNDNSKLAEDLDLAECAKRCPAFDVLNRFVLGLFNARQN